MTHALIHIKHVHIHLPRPKTAGMPTGIPLAAFASAFTQGQRPATKAPAICKPWPGVDGIYVGISAGEEGAPDEHLVLLNARPSTALTHAAGTEWASDQMEGAHMPTRFEGALIYAHARAHVDTSKAHWLSTLYGDSCAWFQHFGYGNQLDDYLSAERAVRAVCRFPL